MKIRSVENGSGGIKLYRLDSGNTSMTPSIEMVNSLTSGAVTKKEWGFVINPKSPKFYQRHELFAAHYFNGDGSEVASYSVNMETLTIYVEPRVWGYDAKSTLTDCETK